MPASVAQAAANLFALRLVTSTDQRLQLHYQEKARSYFTSAGSFDDARRVCRQAQIELAPITGCPLRQLPQPGTAAEGHARSWLLENGNRAECLAMWIERFSAVPNCLEHNRLKMASAYYWWAAAYLPGISRHYSGLPMKMASAFIVRSLHRFDQGQTLLANSDWEMARSFLAQSSFESTGALLERLAQNHREAQQHFLTLELAIHPQESAARIYLASSYNATSQPRKAMAVISPLLATLPSDTRVWQQYGQALLNMRRFSEAETALQHAVSLAPNDLHAVNRLGVLYKVSGQHELAEGVFRQALALDEAARAYWVWEHLGDVLLALGRQTEAADAYATALALAPDGAQETLRTKQFTTSVGE
jgi:tetratricopeptide (TPR) repeat protein